MSDDGLLEEATRLAEDVRGSSIFDIERALEALVDRVRRSERDHRALVERVVRGLEKQARINATVPGEYVSGLHDAANYVRQTFGEDV